MKNNGFINLLVLGVCAVIAVGAAYGYSQVNNKLGAYNVAGGLTYRLQTSIGSTNTSINLSSFKNRSSIPLTMAILNTSVAYGTLDPQTNNSEFISFTGVTQNADGSAQLTGVTRGLSDIYPFTASSTLRYGHSGQSIFILSNAPQVYNEYAAKKSDEAITGLWNFNSYLPTSSIVATSSSQFVTKSYVDGGILAGAATSTESVTGIVRLATALQTASSTASTANTPLVIQAQNATSTYNSATAPLKVVVTKNNGKIDDNFLDLSGNLTLSGNDTLSGNNTFSGTNNFTTSTTTVKGFSASSTAANPLILNTVSYSTPSTQGSASTTLQNDGSGNLTWLGYSKLLTAIRTATQNCSTNDAASTTVYSITIPANTLGTSKGIRVRTNIISGNYNVGDDIWLAVGYGTASTTIKVDLPTSDSLTGNAIEVDIFANGATNSQILNIKAGGGNVAGGGTYSQDSTAEKKLTLITRSISNGPLTCGNTVAEIIQ